MFPEQKYIKKFAKCRKFKLKKYMKQQQNLKRKRLYYIHNGYPYVLPNKQFLFSPIKSK